MPNKMLIDATHPEETRVVVVRGNRVEEFDFETAQRKQLRGNIYLAKVTRVEPSLQAAFIEYGGNRHGFLAFSEIHPDYYQIPMADRQALIEAEEQAHRDAEEETENRSNRRRSRHRSSRRRSHGERVQSDVIEGTAVEISADSQGESGDAAEAHDTSGIAAVAVEPINLDDNEAIAIPHDAAQDAISAPVTIPITESFDHSSDQSAEAPDTSATSNDDATQSGDEAAPVHATAVDAEAESHDLSDNVDDHSDEHDDHDHHADDNTHHSDDHDHDDDEDDDEDDEESEDDMVESVGGDDVLEEVPERAYRPRKQYKIQEVIKRRQVMLVQVVKEERGNKGAALTTYLSLAGRYAVLMPNTARGGGISRKITSAQDRSRLKEVVQDLDVPEGMGIILRTAGATRTKPEIKRDFEYLIRMWETVRDMTLRSQAPTLVYEEGSLIKRSLRDLYNKEIDEIQVAGEDGYHEARDFMHMLMPSNTRAVKLYRDPQPLFSRMGVESQLDAMFSPTVQLRSGGYIVINQTEALVSIDVNSGRSTREHHIEDTALKTNLEAAEEVARQLRLRDLAGLIVIDFIDMDEKRNNRAVERKMSDCLRQDRARIQVGRISHFGLLEMSRQRIRASVLESSTEICPHCGGQGHIRSISSVALQLLRGLEEMLMKGATHNLVVRTRTDIALYVLNHKRDHLRHLEDGFEISITISADEHIPNQQSFLIDRGDLVHSAETARAILTSQAAALPPIDEPNYDDDDIEADSEHDDVEVASGDENNAETATTDADADSDGSKRRRRRRRRGRTADARDDEETPVAAGEAASSNGDDSEAEDEDGEENGADGRQAQPNGDRRPRRRGRRGGRRRRGGAEDGETRSDNGPAVFEGFATYPVFGERPQASLQPVHAELEAHGEAAAEADFLAATTPANAADDVAGHAEVASVAEVTAPVAADTAKTEAEIAPAPAPVAVEPAPAPTLNEAGEKPEAKPTRRRSTVREKVSFVSEAPVEQPALAAAQPVEPTVAKTSEPAAPAPAPAAAAPSESASSNETPRRGWWSRRFGNNG